MNSTSSTTSTSCLCFPKITGWSWSKTAALGFALSTIAVVSTYFAGGHGIGELCAAAGTPFVAILLIQFLYSRKSKIDACPPNACPPNACPSDACILDGTPNSGYQLEYYKAIIIKALREGKPLHWKGKTYDECILPNFFVSEAVANFPTQDRPYDGSPHRSLTIVCDYLIGGRGIGTGEVGGWSRVPFSNDLMHKFCIGYRLNAGGNKEYYYNLLQQALARGSMIEVARDAKVDPQHLGIFVINVLVWITELDIDVVRNYVAKQWPRWRYPDQMKTPDIQFAGPFNDYIITKSSPEFVA